MAEVFLKWKCGKMVFNLAFDGSRLIEPNLFPRFRLDLRWSKGR
jgi:hypothetical protein